MTSKKWVKPSFQSLNNFQSLPSKKEKASQSKKRSVDKCNYSKELWAEKFAPDTVDSLCVHKKKVLEVQNWLLEETSTKGKGKNLLLVTGPAGSGKTATIKTICKQLNIQVREWINPISQSFQNSNGDSNFRVYQESQLSVFRNFLLRANKYCSLASSSSKRIILIKDFPNVFFRDQVEFQKLLRQYKQCSRSAVVFIVTNSAGSDQNERLLFPKHIQSELNIHSISFNPVSNSLLVKALNQAIKTAQTLNLDVATISKPAIDSIVASSCGDLRSAINALQFASVSPLRENFKKPKRKSKKEKDCAEDDLIHGRDVSLSLFRALGKILYSKRNDSETEAKLPSHLSKYRRSPLTFNPEAVIENCSVSSKWFNLFLHQNYLQFFEAVEDVARASRYMSDANILSSYWAGRHVMDEYSTCIASRGIMFSNSHKKSNAWRPLHKPELQATLNKMTQNENEVKNSFSGWLVHDSVIFTDYVPYMKFLNVAKSSVFGDIDKIKSLAVMNNSKDFSRRFQGKEQLNESDIAEIEETTPVILPPHNQEPTTITLSDDEDDPEEFLIEEFSD